MKNKLAAIQNINAEMQLFLRAWNLVSVKRNLPHMLDQASLPWFAELNKELRDELTDAQFAERIDKQLLQLNELAAEIVITLQRDYPQLDASALISHIKPEVYSRVRYAKTQYLFPMAA